MILRGSMSKFAIGGSLGAKDNDTSHLGPFLRVSLEGWPPIYRATVKNLVLGFFSTIFLGVTIHVKKSGKIFGAKSQCKIFHGRPIHTVLQSHTHFSHLSDLADMAPFCGHKYFFRGLVKKGNQIKIVFGWKLTFQKLILFTICDNWCF